MKGETKIQPLQPDSREMSAEMKGIPKKRGVRVLLIAVLILLGCLLVNILGVLISRNFVYTPPFKGTDGKVVQGSIAEFRHIKLGGYSQAILIRGKSLDNPIMLFLHAGPGLSETGLARNFNAALEDSYTMVYLDQRGAGKSYTPFMDYSTFTTEQLLQDIHELTQYLKERFGKEKIAIMGHSFGAGFAAYAAERYPEDYSAFIGIGQPINLVESDSMAFEFALENAMKNGNDKAVKELEKVKGYWLKNDKESYFTGMMIMKKWVGYYGGQIYGQKGFVSFVLKNTLCNEFTIFDYPAYLLGMNASGPASWDIIRTLNLWKQAPAYKIPVILMEGRHDYNTVPDYVESYYKAIKAPVKKLYWFENSAHMLNYEEKELFQKRLMEDVLPIILGK
jgi:pimeloyl-ACP methyl ester carboxylesterase